MSNAFDLVRQAVSESEQIDNAVNENAARMARLLRGRLRHCWDSDLKALKKELRDYNIHTGKWKD